MLCGGGVWHVTVLVDPGAQEELEQGKLLKLKHTLTKIPMALAKGRMRRRAFMNQLQI
jgi:hypothetical protein